MSEPIMLLSHDALDELVDVDPIRLRDEAFKMRAEIDRLNEVADADWKQEVERLKAERDKARKAAKDMGRVIDVVALEMRRAVRLANAGNLAAAMQVITDWASEADWLDNLDDEDNFARPSAPTVEQQGDQK